MAAPTEAKRAWVGRVLGVSLPDGDADPGGAVVRLAKGMILWNQTRSAVAQQIKALQQAILAEAADEPDFDKISANIGRLDVILEVLDDRLIDQLNALRGTTDPDQKRALSDQARGIVREYQAYVNHDKLMADIDDNGFVQLDLKAKIMAALETVLDTI